MWTLDLDTKDTTLKWKNITKEILESPPPKRYGFTMTKCIFNFFIIFKIKF